MIVDGFEQRAQLGADQSCKLAAGRVLRPVPDVREPRSGPGLAQPLGPGAAPANRPMPTVGNRFRAATGASAEALPWSADVMMRQPVRRWHEQHPCDGQRQGSSGDPPTSH